ncbi:hypothetical protein LUZ60_008856 [Juncus effusus]|nr:hypothetical protein LUZ60_008856 [Juncus effusus]
MANHLSFFLICCYLAYYGTSVVPPVEVNIGVILDFSSVAGNMSLTSMNLALSDFYSENPNSSTRLVLHVRDSQGDVAATAAAAFDLLHLRKVQLIIGPQYTKDAQNVLVLAEHGDLLMLSFSTNNDTSLPVTPLPFLTLRTPSDAMLVQARAIADLITTNRPNEVAFIYEDTREYAAFLPHIINEVGALVRVLHRVPISNTATNDRIYADLISLTEMRANVFIMHTTVRLASRLFEIARVAGLLSDGYIWVTTEAITSYIESVVNHSIFDSSLGVLGLRPYIIPSTKVQRFQERWRSKFLKENITRELVRLTAYELWAYDSLWAVAIAINHTTMTKNNKSIHNKEFFESIKRRKFEGISGWFSVVNGGPPVGRDYEILAIEEDKRFGIWTRKEGITWRRSLKALAAAPISGKLRIAIPVSMDPWCSPILEVDRNNGTNQLLNVRGLVFDIFAAVVALLPYNLDYEYVPFVNDQGHRFGDYNELMRQVSLKSYDAAVGDITITSNRMSYVDFTLPYMDSSVSMLVPLTGRKNPWSFLLPWTVDLWVATVVLFVLTGAALWKLEHKTNAAFKGSFTKHLFNILFASFYLPINGSSGDKGLTRDISKIVLIVFTFIIFTLSASYTANLASIFTTEQLKPAVTTIQELIKNQEYVGYLKDSYVKGVLLNMGLKESQLKPYTSVHQYADALNKGSKNGGVAAILDEMPYLNLFSQYYCCNYTISPEFYYKVGGFGFAFPRGSVLAQDFSMAIINLTESGKFSNIQSTWFADSIAPF